nr:(r,s)-reticuline 7-o-methyltransferase [Quercus suber]
MLNLGSLLFPGYAQTPLSRCLMRQEEHSMAAFILMESSPVMLAPWLSLSARVLANGTSSFMKARDVGGDTGTTIKQLVKACPWLQGINFDLPHVVSIATEINGVKHAGGDMFESVPKADTAFIMADNECIQILKKCKERTLKEWGFVLGEAGFSGYTVKPIPALQSVIEAFL